MVSNVFFAPSILDPLASGIAVFSMLIRNEGCPQFGQIVT